MNLGTDAGEIFQRSIPTEIKNAQRSRAVAAEQEDFRLGAFRTVMIIQILMRMNDKTHRIQAMRHAQLGQLQTVVARKETTRESITGMPNLMSHGEIGKGCILHGMLKFLG
jgi:hypothetical protein